MAEKEPSDSPKTNPDVQSNHELLITPGQLAKYQSDLISGVSVPLELLLETHGQRWVVAWYVDSEFRWNHE
jgi:hypothetical protein